MKLEIKHLAPYLPYGLKAKFQAKNKKTCRKYVIGTVSVMYSDCSICCYDTVNATPDQFKPILRPLSDLTKEIEVNGEKFVPVKKIHEKGEKWHSEPIVSHYIKRVYFTKGYDYIPHWMFQDLIKWHFDVFGLIDKGLALPLTFV